MGRNLPQPARKPGVGPDLGSFELLGALEGSGPSLPGLRQSAPFARVPDPQDVDGLVNHPVAHFVVADDDAAHFARQVLIQLTATLGAIK